MQDRDIAIVVAGGQSRRMKPLGDKLLLPRGPGDVPILLHVVQRALQVADDVYVAYANEMLRRTLHDLGLTNARWIRDRLPTAGPLQAIAGVLREIGQTSFSTFFLIAGDLPGITHDVLRRLKKELLQLDKDVDGVVVVRAGRIQPLLACYRPSAIRAIDEAYLAGETRLMAAIQRMNIQPMEWAPDEALSWVVRPVHTPDDYQEWLVWRDGFETS
ncbi:molybdenum cofactor guanylyltransferase [Alicyclobacillus dauci]|uniref:Molybdenum cofactor guanylyltransferase n=1 Tax=Alicyclobacillus dauci TaxID=1475485 RepID=A0ABY6Z2C3_9BACL|nr:molybdenum cofactor guanylyltransferase [Alicyclobacillus dauci]WAH36663.1 molybdenum cofactor guanylyltransferase [Alicyclobacillus dauci]